MNKIFQIVTIRTAVTFVVFILVVGVLFISAMMFWVKPELEEELRESVDKDFERITLAIHQHLQHASVTAQALANAAKLMPVVSQKQSQLIKPLFKSIIATPGSEYLIAGGGLWPEPFQFNPEKERDSYFWGRNKDNRLIFYDDYNLLVGPGYHHQEWYMPARYIEPGSVYWSKSYIDPYSLQPMVTATVPIVNDGNFIGVSTVDVKLEGLGKLLQVINERYPRKVFLVDRNLQIIAKPPVQSLENEALEVDNVFYDMAEFKQVETVLNERREQRIVKAQDDLEIRQLAKAMSLAQGEIDVDEGLLIASGIHLKKSKGSSFFTGKSVMEGAILSEQRILFSQLIPSLQWTIAIVEDRVDIPVLKTLVDNFNPFKFSFLIICLVFIYGYIHRHFIKPLRIIDHQLVEYEVFDDEWSQYIEHEIVADESKKERAKDVISRISQELAKRDKYLKHALELLHDGSLAREPEPELNKMPRTEAEQGVSFIANQGETPLGNDKAISTVSEQLRGCNLLLVEDDKVSRQLLHAFCQRQGLSLMSVKTGEDVLPALQGHHFDAVLLDLNLPGMNGVRVKQLIRDQQEFKQLPVIMISATIIKAQEEFLEGDSFCGFFHKTLPLEQLLFKLATWLPNQSESTAIHDPVNTELSESSTFVLTEQQVLNVKVGVSYCGGDMQAYQALLNSFRDQFKGFGLLSKTYWGEDDQSQLQKLLRSMRKSAVIIGAEKLPYQVDALVAICRQEPVTKAATESAISAVKKELEGVLIAINTTVTTGSR